VRWWMRLEMFLDYRNGIVKPHAVQLPRHLVKREYIVLIGIPAVHFVDQAFGVLDKALLLSVTTAETGPVAGMCILDNIAPPILQMGPRCFKTGDLLMHLMTAIVDYYVKRSVTTGYVIQKGAVRLVADVGSDLRVTAFLEAGVTGTARIYVNENQVGAFAKIAFPHGY